MERFSLFSGNDNEPDRSGLSDTVLGPMELLYKCIQHMIEHEFRLGTLEAAAVQSPSKLNYMLGAVDVLRSDLDKSVESIKLLRLAFNEELLARKRVESELVPLKKKIRDMEVAMQRMRGSAHGSDDVCTTSSAGLKNQVANAMGTNGACTRDKRCFICKETGHKARNCSKAALQC